VTSTSRHSLGKPTPSTVSSRENAAVDDPADPEFQPPTYDGFRGAGERQGYGANVIEGPPWGARGRLTPKTVMNMKLACAAGGEKMSTTSSSKDVEPTAPRPSACVARCSRPAYRAASSWGQPIATVAVVGQDRFELGQVVAVDVGVGGVLLVEGQVGGLRAEVAGANQLDRAFAGAMQVQSGRQTVDGIDDQIAVVQWRRAWRQAIGGKTRTERSSRGEKASKLIGRSRS